MSLRKVLDSGAKLSPPPWLRDNLCYETLMGSIAYGVEGEASDVDIYGICFPLKEHVFPHLNGEIFGFGTQLKRFEQWQEHHIQALGKEWDFQIFSIVKFFQLALENNPNILDSLFTPRRCILSSTPVGEMIKENRKLFLHKGAWPKFKGYAYSQLSKIRSKNTTGKRIELVEKYGYDCYSASDTEFLTDCGWKSFDDITYDDSIGVVDAKSGNIGFEKPIGKIDKIYSGRLYTIEPYMSRCVVTERHQMLVSPCHRGPSNGYSSKFESNNSNWQLTPMESVATASRSFFHIRTAGICSRQDYDISDEYLKLSGLFVSEGTVEFRNDKVKNARISQTVNGKDLFYSVADGLAESLYLKRYDYNKETIWLTGRALAERLHADFGHYSHNKKLPKWCFALSSRQAKILWDAAMLGDGTNTPSDGQVYYTSSKFLADGLHAMLTSAGFCSSVRGPFEYKNKISSMTGRPAPPMYQVYLSSQDAYRAVDFNKKIPKGSLDKKYSSSIKYEDVSNHRVVCFETPSGTIITRSNGNTAFHGNCKFGSHCVRLLLEVEQILALGDIDLERDREQIKGIRRGEWTLEQLESWAAEKEKDLEKLYANSPLPWGPDEAAIKKLLLCCLEQHWGDLSTAVTVVGEPEKLLAQIAQLTKKYIK